MADNVSVGPTTSLTVATDEVGSVQYQKVKLVNAAADSEEEIGTSAKPLPIISMSQLVPKLYDNIFLTYIGDNLTTVLYKVAGDTVATLTLTYSGVMLETITRS